MTLVKGFLFGLDAGNKQIMMIGIPGCNSRSIEHVCMKPMEMADYIVQRA